MKNRKGYISPSQHRKNIESDIRTHRREQKNSDMLDRQSILNNFERLRSAGFPSTRTIEREVYTSYKVRALGALIIGKDVSWGRRSVITSVYDGYVVPGGGTSYYSDSRIDGGGMT